ncbi:MAG TPA: flagellar basal-body rod protein FlgG [Candidatus Aquicultor sp.]|jgi:flagellar basal-body rod protein FlgG
MIRALWTSASALTSGQAAVDAIGNNIANVSTTGYKKGVVQFKDLFYQRANELGVFVPDSHPQTGISIGTGVRAAGAQRMYDQGRLEQTDSSLDLAIDGEGFFKVLLADGTPAYTRDGSFKVNAQGELVTAQGYKLDPAVTIPPGARDITIGADGMVRGIVPGSDTIQQIGSISLYKAANINGLLGLGENMYETTSASGTMYKVTPSGDGVGTIKQGFLEGSNVDLSDEMTQLVIAQRAFQINARALSNADQMMQVAIQIRG